MCLHLSIIAASEEKVRNYSTRLRLTIGQTSVLEAAFRNNCFPNKDTLMLLAQQTGLTERRVRRWLSERRTKIRHGRKEGAVPINEKKGDDNSIPMNITLTCN